MSGKFKELVEKTYESMDGETIDEGVRQFWTSPDIATYNREVANGIDYATRRKNQLFKDNGIELWSGYKNGMIPAVYETKYDSYRSVLAAYGIPSAITDLKPLYLDVPLDPTMRNGLVSMLKKGFDTFNVSNVSFSNIDKNAVGQYAGFFFDTMGSENALKPLCVYSPNGITGEIRRCNIMEIDRYFYYYKINQMTKASLLNAKGVGGAGGCNIERPNNINIKDPNFADMSLQKLRALYPRKLYGMILPDKADTLNKRSAATSTYSMGKSSNAAWNNIADYVRQNATSEIERVFGSIDNTAYYVSKQYIPFIVYQWIDLMQTYYAEITSCVNATDVNAMSKCWMNNKMMQACGTFFSSFYKFPVYGKRSESEVVNEYMNTLNDDVLQNVISNTYAIPAANIRNTMKRLNHGLLGNIVRTGAQKMMKNAINFAKKSFSDAASGSTWSQRAKQVG